MRTRRLTADLVDAIALLVAGLLLSSTLGDWLAARAGLALRIGDPAGCWQGPLPFLLGFVGGLIHALPVAALLLLAPEATAAGASLGKLLVRLRVAGPPADRRRRFLIKTAGWWLHLLGLLLAWWPLLAAALLANLVLLLGALPILAGRPALHERLSGAQLT